LEGKWRDKNPIGKFLAVYLRSYHMFPTNTSKKLYASINQEWRMPQQYWGVRYDMGSVGLLG
jgi:hypothetical protein